MPALYCRTEPRTAPCSGKKRVCLISFCCTCRKTSKGLLYDILKLDFPTQIFKLWDFPVRCKIAQATKRTIYQFLSSYVAFPLLFSETLEQVELTESMLRSVCFTFFNFCAVHSVFFSAFSLYLSRSSLLLFFVTFEFFPLVLIL